MLPNNSFERFLQTKTIFIIVILLLLFLLQHYKIYNWPGKIKTNLLNQYVPSKYV